MLIAMHAAATAMVTNATLGRNEKKNIIRDTRTPRSDISQLTTRRARAGNECPVGPGITRVILNITEAASQRLLQSIRGRLVKITDPFLIHNDRAIRELAAAVFLTLLRRVNETLYTE